MVDPAFTDEVGREYTFVNGDKVYLDDLSYFHVQQMDDMQLDQLKFQSDEAARELQHRDEEYWDMVAGGIMEEQMMNEPEENRL